MVQLNTQASQAKAGRAGRARLFLVIPLCLGACAVTATVIYYAAQRQALSPDESADPARFSATPADVPDESAVGSGDGVEAPERHEARGDTTPSRRGDSAPLGDAFRATERLGQQQQTPWNEVDDPASDGWQTEVFQAQAGAQLKALAKAIAHSPIAIDAGALSDLVTQDFRCQPLLPEHLKTVFSDQGMTVEREDRPRTSSPDAREFLQAKGFRAALAEMLSPLGDVSDLRMKFKVVSVDLPENWPKENSAMTRQLVELAARTPGAMIEQHASWTIEWVVADNAPPRIRDITMENFEQTRSTNRAGPRYADCTASVVGANACYQPQFLRGLNQWLRQMQSRSPVPIQHTGLAIGDMNGDGLDDLYVCQESGLPNRLFVQLPDGTAEDVSAAWGVDWLDETRSALLVDLDNDGDQDLVLATIGHVVIALNKGTQHEGTQFEVHSYLPCSFDTTSLSTADYDNDGDLDLFVCVYSAYAGDLSQHDSSRSAISLPASFVLHNATGGGANHLFRNELTSDGTLEFVDVTVEVGMDIDNRRYCYAASWDDFDNDGDQDLYVANDFGRNHLFRNDVSTSGQFVDVATGSGALDQAQGMSVSWADFNRDGLMDLYVGNMFSSAGNRIVPQRQFKTEVDPQTREKYLYLARGNTLLQNTGHADESTGPTFRDVSASADVTMGRWAWGTNFVDINNDGWEDLVVANGNITGRADQDGGNSGDL